MYKTTVTEASRSIGVSRQWVHQMIHQGLIRAIKRGPMMLVHAGDVRKAKEAREKKFQKST